MNVFVSGRNGCWLLAASCKLCHPKLRTAYCSPLSPLAFTFAMMVIFVAFGYVLAVTTIGLF